MEHPDTLISMENLASAYSDAGNFEQAIPYFEQILQFRQSKLGSEPPDTFNFRIRLATLYHLVSRHNDSLAVIDPALATERLSQPSNVESKNRRASMLILRAEALNPLLRWTEAEASAREAIEILADTSPVGWGGFKAKSVLGESLLGQGKLDDAEPFLLEGYHGLKEREAKLPVSDRDRLITAAVTRLVRLYDAREKPEEAAKWRQILEELEAKAGQASEAP